VDVNEDGFTDILSGCYSRHDSDMAGLFYVLYGKKDRSFGKAEELKGTDGQPLILPGDSSDKLTDRICTRPTAVDLNGDGKLDIVSGNFAGTFFFIAGEGKGKFAPAASLLKAGEEPLRVEMHSDPFFVDWDQDGDLDLLSGSASGGVFYSENTGTKKEPAFKKFAEMVAPAGHSTETVIAKDDEHLKGPASGTRVWADDLDGDGLLDLLVGDQVQLHTPVDVDIPTAQKKYDEWMVRQQKLVSTSPWSQGEEPSAKVMEAYQEAYQKLEDELATFLKREGTGYVWVLRQQKQEK